MSPQRILIVEDEPDGADLVRRLLKSNGLETTIAINAEIAVSKLAAAPEDYMGVVVDLALPEMDGFELMQVIRGDARLQHLPLIAITAFHTPELKVRALEGGFDAYCPKPLDAQTFIQALAGILA
ncbi:MAG: response regulator [Anaerolineae bacterium]